jgi:hypothetical protein
MDSIARKMTHLGIEPMNGEAFKPLSADDIARLQNKLGATLPEAYAQFLMRFGPSMFAREINCTPHAEPLYFGWFYGPDELVEAVENLREVLPESIIPFADDGGGNTFCLGLQSQDLGKVYFHNHGIGWQADAETCARRGEPVPARIRYQTVHEVAPSFEQFVLNMIGED